MSGPDPVPGSGFKLSRRKAVTVSTVDLVHTGYVEAGHKLPLMIQPASENVDGLRWIEDHGEFIQAELLRHGAILFRNFPISSQDDFRLLVNKIAREPMAYTERSSPRTEVGENIYTSTDYPANESIFPHNEHSYSDVFPLKLFFWCKTAAQQGGETPLGDTRQIYARIPGEIKEKFAAKGWMFVRNFNYGFGLPWQTVFQTDDKARVEEYCRCAGIESEWRGGDKLRTRQVRPAIARHPYTEEAVWFNHATFFHQTNLPTSVSKALHAEYADHDLPNNTFYGDGSVIPEEVINVLRDAYLKEMVSFSWQEGDVVLIDNMLTAHARNSFVGPRRILVAMAEPYHADGTGSRPKA